ncbi:S-adenosyl-L-methionine-dependent methyltransferase [Parathielavia appendiculata]|uniref:S-adenosyl-L-methionine-dependent methyltransferase n=1 Tax=Parathielavia appendiculata TaxID=2587402 RepID=A0AAN6U5M3_9PEZI|nr:S-adenosyl-L-methionine-dependent methyltransferase [Parathielavia appendiculata]
MFPRPRSRSQSGPEPELATRPSTSSTQIAVDMDSDCEEDLYAIAEAMRQAMMRANSPHQINVPTITDGRDPEPGPRGGTFAFDDDMARYPASMTSSVRDHVYEGGLRYHAYHAGKYAFPNDEVEQNRDDMKHTMTLMLCRGAYFYAPVDEVLEEGGEVLDLGTGTGIWAMELGDRYPNSTITGIDLSPIQPTFVPENVHFFVDDFDEEWVDPENKYDFIHLRHTLHSVKNRQTLLRRVLHHLKPNGYFEAQEIAFTPRCDDDTLTLQTPYALRDYVNYMAAGMRALGSEAHAILTLPDDMRAAGFDDVRLTTHKCPLGTWPRDKRLRFCGLFLRTVIMDGLRGLSRRPLMALGWTELQIEMFLVDVRKALMDNGVHAYMTLHVVHGRKPAS